jgi:hypothetical protein
MFNNPTTPRYSLEEGTVIQIDHIRFLCKVRTTRGQILDAVTWVIPVGGSNRSGDRLLPMMGDRVLVEFGLGYPIIMGFLPRLQTQDGVNPISIVDDDSPPDTGNYSPEGGSVWADQNKPANLTTGDRIISSIGGNMLALLRSGLTIIRGSRSAEIVLSPLFSLVRVVSRNWEHFTDASTDVIKNYKNKVYRYVGYARTFLNAKIEAYNLHFYYGDVKAAETIKANYNNYSGNPASDNTIYKEQITGPLASSGTGELMRRILDIDGSEEVNITNGNQFAKVTTKNDQLVLNWNNQCSITVKESEVHLIHKDGADILMNSSGIVNTFNAHTIKLEGTQATVIVGASTVAVDNSQITLTNGAGNALVSSAQTKLVNGSHSITVTSSGVAVT